MQCKRCKRRRENTPVCGVTGFISNMINTMGSVRSVLISTDRPEWKK